MKKKHKRKDAVQIPRSLKECFKPRKGEEFSYLGNATYKLDKRGEVSGKHIHLVLFYQAVSNIAKPRLMPSSLLRVLRLLENRGNLGAGRLRLLLLGGNSIEWMGWRWEKFRIRGNFDKKIEVLAKKTSREIEDASHAGWFI